MTTDKLLGTFFIQEAAVIGFEPGKVGEVRICVGVGVDGMVEEEDKSAQFPLQCGLCTMLRFKEPLETSLAATSKGALPHL